MAGSPDRRPPTPDIAFLQERGGLTPAHWEEVVRRYGNPRNPIAAKVVAYGQRVVNGDFPDTGFHHRQYLGSWHWDRIYSSIDNHPYYSRTQSSMQTAQYASLEQKSQFTLDDHFRYHCGRSFTINWEGNYRENVLRWDEEKHMWRKISYYHNYSEGPYDPNAGENVTYYWISSKDTTPPGIFTGWIDRLLLRKLLLRKGELENPKHKSPEELLSFMRSSIPVEALNERLRRFLAEEGSYAWSTDYPDSLKQRHRWFKKQDGFYFDRYPWTGIDSDEVARRIYEAYFNHFGYHPFVYVKYVDYGAGALHNFRVYRTRQDCAYYYSSNPKSHLSQGGDIIHNDQLPPIQIGGWEKEVT